MKLPKFTLPRFSLPSCRPGALCGRFSVRGFVSFCRMIRIEHSIFALPYAWAGSVMAGGGVPPGGQQTAACRRGTSSSC